MSSGSTKVLGISAYYHDSAAALLVDGRIIGAAQEERFTRKKHDASFPVHAVRYCLDVGNLSLADLDYVVFYDKPLRKFKRLVATYLALAPRGLESFRAAMPVWLTKKAFQRSQILTELETINPGGMHEDKLLFAEHHQSHAASAFFASPFKEAVALTMDGVGEWATTSVCIGSDNKLRTVKEIQFPNSLGMLYSAFTSYLGFRVNSGEYKIMGLAPYGKPVYADLITDHLIALHDDGSFSIDLDYFDYATGLRMTNEKLHALFGGEPRKSGNLLEQRHMDLAASIQAVTEKVVLNLASSAATEFGCKNLCLAGGVALNCVANGKLLRAGLFDELWIQPAAGDAGGAIGAAYAGYHQFLDHPRIYSHGDSMQGSYLGPEFSAEDIEKRLTTLGAKYTYMEESALLDATAKSLAAGNAVGWFQGRMEFGPRALGNRSILGDPRSTTMQQTLNLKIKYRESFRPFAPSVLQEDTKEWFELSSDSPYMLLVAQVAEKHLLKMDAKQEALFGIDKLNVARSAIPAVTHVDYSARVQTVDKHTNPRYHALLQAFKNETGVGMLINTSFNIRGEPIVGTPEDAFRCFMGTEMDTLVVGNYLMEKEEQTVKVDAEYKDSFKQD